MFGRWATKRTPSSNNNSAASPNATSPAFDSALERQQQQQQQQQYHGSTSTLTPDSDRDQDRGPPKLQSSRTWAQQQPHHHHHPPPQGPPLPPHRRDSSILSLTTTNLTDLGANVRRSVSLRSHRTTPSSGSSFGVGTNLKARSPNGFTPLSSASPTEGLEETAGFSFTPPPQADRPGASPTTSPQKEQGPLLRRKISLTAKGLSQRFAKSTEALPPLNSAIYLDNVGVRSPTAVSVSDPMASTSTLVNSVANAPSPPRALTRKPSAAPSETGSRPPGLHPQGSFSRNLTSSHGDPNGASLSLAPPPPGSMGGPLHPKTIYLQIQETSAKRMGTIDYLRKLHEGDIFYFGTMHYSQASLAMMPSMYPHKLGRRATNYFLLAYSLPAVLDLNSGNPLEYLKALSSLLTEFETYQTLSGFDSSGNTVSRGRMGQMFKSGMGLGGRTSKGRRSSTTADTLSLDARQADLLGMPTAGRSPSDAHSPIDTASPINPTNHEFAYLLTPHIPFDPDFNVTLGSLCDILIDVYAKLMDLVSSPDTCSPSVGTEFTKADKAIRKILVANVVKEFEDTTRAGVKGELAGLGKLVLGGLS